MKKEQRSEKKTIKGDNQKEREEGKNGRPLLHAFGGKGLAHKPPSYPVVQNGRLWKRKELRLINYGLGERGTTLLLHTLAGSNAFTFSKA